MWPDVACTRLSVSADVQKSERASERAPPQRLPLGITLGSLSNDDGDGNENGKKAIGLDWQNNNFARASRLFLCRCCTTTT